MQHPSNVKPRPNWRRLQLAEHWQCSDRKVDRMHKDGRLGKPKYVGRTPIWTDEQREAAERGERDSTA
jgi:hypothetical protein